MSKKSSEFGRYVHSSGRKKYYRFQSNFINFVADPVGVWAKHAKHESELTSEDGILHVEVIVENTLEDGTLIKSDDPDIWMKVGRCDVNLGSHFRTEKCHLQGLVERCFCGRRMCRFHQMRINITWVDPDLHAYLNSYPLAILDHINAGKYICWNCFMYLVETFEEIVIEREKRLRRGKFRQLINSILRRGDY